MPPGLRSPDVYLVIFKAAVAQLDDEYFRTAEKLRDLAISKYGCLDFVAVTEGDQEIAISYWENRQQIRDWKDDPEHVLAQEAGRDRWYQSYSVEICELQKAYKQPG